jgi:septal ring factor EnvC (AmiA/AmiB activator)
MKKIFIVVMIISICSIFLTSNSWAIWPFPLPSWKNNEQAKINNLEKQLQVERQMKEDAQTKTSELEDQLQYERQMKESVQTKIGDFEKQLQVERQMKEDAQKDKAKAESSRGLWMYLSAGVGLVCLLLGIAIGSKFRRAAKIQQNADG